MRAARFPVSVELLGDVLHLPVPARIIGAHMSDDGRCVVLTVDDHNLPEADEPHDTVPTVTRESVRWNWNVEVTT